MAPLFRLLGGACDGADCGPHNGFPAGEVNLLAIRVWTALSRGGLASMRRQPTARRDVFRAQVYRADAAIQDLHVGRIPAGGSTQPLTPTQAGGSG
jgi:hypothetical protein